LIFADAHLGQLQAIGARVWRNLKELAYDHLPPVATPSLKPANLKSAQGERISELLAAHRLPAPDAIVSGIPFSAMPTAVGERIAAAVSAALAPGGRFVAYQVTPWVSTYTSPHLGPPKFEVELWNIPPMRVFTWVKKG
jgi:phospholipid N-methyltransferase